MSFSESSLAKSHICGTDEILYNCGRDIFQLCTTSYQFLRRNTCTCASKHFGVDGRSSKSLVYNRKNGKN